MCSSLSVSLILALRYYLPQTYYPHRCMWHHPLVYPRYIPSTVCLLIYQYLPVPKVSLDIQLPFIVPTDKYSINLDTDENSSKELMPT